MDNLFEKKGIKDVADVTLYRIEKKKEKYESQRNFSVASILKGAITKATVYPFTVEGKGSEDGFEAYVFTNANILTHYNYDCDDTVNVSDKNYGAFDMDETGEGSDHTTMDPDKTGAGTHEFSYAEQICMLFAKNQNLINKTGTRYRFANPDSLLGSFEFSDQFSAEAGSKEKIVVVGLSGKLSENLYDINEFDEAVKNLTSTFEAKAYNITYSDYAELVVEDEMGYYIPKQLGYAYDKSTGTVTFFDVSTPYSTWAGSGKGVDFGINNAINSWGTGAHYSINDAIDALKQQVQIIDSDSSADASGYNRAFGGYVVAGEGLTVPFSDDALKYDAYSMGGTALNSSITGSALKSKFNLDDVINALSTADYTGTTPGDVKIDPETGKASNRAIYVESGDATLAKRANIYILKNTAAAGLARDEAGVFEFYDKKGNKLFYKDAIFARKETLALVTIGNYGLIFVVNRYGNKEIKKTAWVMNDNGYITDKQAKKIVNNGLIHTIEITNGDAFSATCTVKDITICRFEKETTTYIPCLYFDTLKTTSWAQTCEEVSATGGKGNSKLISWDFGKEIEISITDALITPASMAMIWGGGDDPKKAIKEIHKVDRSEKFSAKRNFIIPAGNANGYPSEAELVACTVYIDPNTMEPYQDGTPIAEGETIIKWTRSISYDNSSLGSTIEVISDKFPGIYKMVGETETKSKDGKIKRMQIEVCEAKLSANDTSLNLEADGDPTVIDFKMTVLRPENRIMMKINEYEVVDNEEENDGSTMVKNTKNINLLDEAKMFKVNTSDTEETVFIGETEY